MHPVLRRSFLILSAVTFVAASTGCGDDSSGGEDFVQLDGQGDGADGLVDVPINDGIDPDMGDMIDVPPTDMVDPCDGISTCAAEGAMCNEDDLVVCRLDANGCLTDEVTDCAAATRGGFCDADAALCAVDPCAEVANPCMAEGRVCSTDTLVICEPNAFGCLEETIVDCAASMGTCDDTPMLAVCTNGPDCTTVPNGCAAEGTQCNGPALVTCSPDAFGCLVETTNDCTATPNGFCDTSGTTDVCGVSTVDPCDGVAQCTPEGRSCANDSLVVCAPDAFGCVVETSVDCTATMEICDDTGAVAVCRPPCTDECMVDGETTCNGSSLSLCSDSNGDTCLDLTITDCAANNEYCDVSGMVPACTAQGSGDSCADPIVVQASTSFAGNSFEGEFDNQQDLDGGAGCDNTQTGNGSEVIYQVDLAANESVVVRESGGVNVIRRVLGTCADNAACLDSVSPDPPDLIYGATMDETVFVVVEAFSPNDPRGYDIEIEIVPSVCGDGFESPDEACDDGNTVSNDGCAMDCQMVEMGFECFPGICIQIGAGDTCQTAIGLTGTGGTISMSTSTYGDDYLFYSGCGTGGGRGPDVVYSVQLQPGEVLDAELTSFSYNASVVIADVCPSLEASCLDYDSIFGANGLDVTYENDIGMAKTVFLIVDSGNNNSPSSGDFTVEWSVRTPVCGDGFVDSGEECDDGNTSAGDGCGAMCQLEGDVCPDAIVLSGSTTIQGDTTPYVDDYGPYGGACGNLQGNGPDVVYAIDVAAGQYLNVTHSFGPTAAETLALVTDCADINGTCLAADNTLPDPRVAGWQNDTGATQTVYIIVDGVGGNSDGPFDLTVELSTPVCGDGMLQGDACDDGNTMDMDGCSAMCTVEMGFACYGAPSLCYTAGAGDTCAAMDVIVLPGSGLYGGDTSVGYANDYSGYAMAGCQGPIFNGSGTGPDQVFSVVLQPNETLDVAAVPETGYDVAVILITDASMACATINGMTCVDSDDNQGPSVTEDVSYTNGTNAPQTVFIVIDGFNGDSGSFDLTVDIN